MISPISSYGQVSWPAYGIQAGGSQRSTVHAVGRGSDPEVPVQPVDAAIPVTPKTPGSVNNVTTASLSPQAGAEAAELAVRMRMNQEEVPAGQTVAGSEETQKKDFQTTLQEAQEAEEKRDAYLEKMAEAEQAREERISELREALTEETNVTGAEEEEEAQGKDGEEKAASAQEEAEPQTGFLTLDHTAALLRNHQMTNLLHDQITAWLNGEDTSGYSAAIEALLENSQDRVRFVSGREEESANRQNPYQSRGNYAFTGAA